MLIKKIYLQGYYGHNNLGDDYIFYSLVDEISSLKNQYEVNVDIQNVTYDGRLYKDIVDHYDNVKLKATNASGGKGKLRRILPIMKSDYFIIGGGGYFLQKVLSI